MELISHSKEEHKFLKRMPPRLTPELRTRLLHLRHEYEAAHSDRLGFDTLFPPAAATCGDDETRAAELLTRYDEYLGVAAQLYGDMSVSGSRRVATNCGSFAAAVRSWKPGSLTKRLSLRTTAGYMVPRGLPGFAVYQSE